MTAKEAIQTIEAAKAEVEWNYPLNYATAFEVAIEVLEKQIPKKPKENLDGNLACQCGFVIQNGKNRKCIYYCTYCGQALDWSDIE